jgi:hypothetical protein
VKRRSEMDIETMNIETKLDEYAQVVGFQCPAEFWPALGYEGEARYVAIWWEPGGDEACWGDGRISLCGAEWPAYQALIQHNYSHRLKFIPELLGSSEEAAVYYLVVDRETERGWLVPAEKAGEVLRLQWPVEDVAADGVGSVPFEAVTFEEFVERVKSLSVMTLDEMMAEVEQRLAESQARYEALVTALERRKGA